MSGAMSFLFDTLLWTGALIGLVLVLRRPVARAFGPGAAYALWLLPVLRLALPPLTLPAWLNPDPEPLATPLDPAQFATFDTASIPEAATPAAPLIDWPALLLSLWLAGAAIFLVRRFWLYFALRRHLLEGARPVGETGRVRLVESPSIAGPVAFGVLDKVIALPWGFMARHDRHARDLAIAHELQHHRGGDLLANVLVQPLFALHWFNPLGLAGWRALRRDQEAACDARVVALCDRAERAVYARVIADFARRGDATPRPALAAAMACPVLGDKSVIQRLRSLTRSDVSPRRRHAGRFLVGGSLLLLPLTATIAYAEVEPPAPPPAPAAPEAPLAPEFAGGPVPPEPPAPPAAPAAPLAPRLHNVSVTVVRTVDENGKVRLERRIVPRDGHELSAQERADLERELDDAEKDIAKEFEKEFGDGRRGREIDLEVRREVERAMAEGGRALRSARVAGQAAARAAERAALAAARAPEVVEDCRNPRQPVTSITYNGRTRLLVCKTAAAAIRREALNNARAAIAREPNIPAEDRAEALRDIDEELAQPDGDKISLHPVSLPVVSSQADECPEEKARRLNALA